MYACISESVCIVQCSVLTCLLVRVLLKFCVGVMNPNCMFVLLNAYI